MCQVNKQLKNNCFHFSETQTSLADAGHEVLNMHYVHTTVYMWHEWLMISCLDLLYHHGYHFIKMLNRPVDLSLRFIVVCVAESLTWGGGTKQTITTMTFKSYQSQITKYTFNGRNCFNYVPQWQKSDEIMKRLEGSAKYFASSFPYSSSLFSLRAPTSTGTMLNSSLWLQKTDCWIKNLSAISCFHEQTLLTPVNLNESEISYIYPIH